MTPPVVLSAAHQLILALGLPADRVSVRWAHGSLERASALAHSLLSIGFTTPQQAWIIEAQSTTATTCSGCVGVVEPPSRVHGIIVLDAATPQALGSYAQDVPADLTPVGDVHRLPAPTG